MSWGWAPEWNPLFWGAAPAPAGRWGAGAAGPGIWTGLLCLGAGWGRGFRASSQIMDLAGALFSRPVIHISSALMEGRI